MTADMEKSEVLNDILWYVEKSECLPENIYSEPNSLFVPVNQVDLFEGVDTKVLTRSVIVIFDVLEDTQTTEFISQIITGAILKNIIPFPLVFFIV